MLKKVQTPPDASDTRSSDSHASDTPSSSDHPAEGRSDRSGPPEPTDEELDALRQRDPAAIERWIYGNRGIVRGMLMKMVKDADLADELLQETYYQAMRSIENFRGDSKVSTWLCSIARNLAFRHFRTQDRYTTVESDTLEWMGHEELPEDAPYDGNPRHDAERSERTELVHAAMQELSDSYRQIIRLRDLKEKSTEEVAEELGLTRVNVRVRLHRARQQLQELLRPKLAGSFSRAA